MDESHLRDLRATMAQFASGVAVVTTIHAGEPYGTTVSAFCSVSIDPPMALVSLARSSRTLAMIRASGVYAVNVLLADSQRPLARRFAGRDPRGKTFADILYHQGATGAPLFDEALARIECRVAAEYPGWRPCAAARLRRRHPAPRARAIWPPVALLRRHASLGESLAKGLDAGGSAGTVKSLLTP